MSFNRLIFALLIVAAILLVSSKKIGTIHDPLLGMAIFIALALGVLGHIVLYPGICRFRRIVALLLDCCFLSYQLHLGGDGAALFFPIYLWVIFGNGFRFGIGFLAIAVPVATLCFGVVIVTTPFWYQQPYLSVGLLVGLIILPAYAGTLIRRLSQATRLAEEASNAKSLFLASVSHELRTPLTAIVGMAGLLRAGGRLNGEQVEFLQTIEVATGSLKSLINGLLDLSRIDAGRMPHLPEEFDLLALLVDVRRLVESQVRKKGLRFDIHVTARTPLKILASRLHLHEILVNLAGNAVKFTETGGVVLAVDAEPAEGSDTSFSLKIEVSDTGIGIEPQDQSRIFETFTQANPTILNRFGGTGLGLAITRRLVTLLGGTIEVESSPGIGSTFRIAIKVETVAEDMTGPAAQAGAAVLYLGRDPKLAERLREHLANHEISFSAADPKAPLPPLTPGQVLMAHPTDMAEDTLASVILPTCPVVLIDGNATASLPDIALRRRCVTLLSELSSTTICKAIAIARRLGNPIGEEASSADAMATEQPTPLPKASRRRRVLLADDNRINQRVLTRILEAAGHEVLLAENGDLALDILEQEAATLDIVLMDFNMPETDGLEATKLYRMMSTGDDRLPIVGLTADATAQKDMRWRDAGMDGCLIKPVDPSALLAAVETMARKIPTATANADLVTPLHEHPRFRAKPPLDDAILANLQMLGDRQFIAELLSDFLSDAGALIESLAMAAQRGDTPAFRSLAHSLQSSAANVGATALGGACTPWSSLGSSELKAQANAFATHAQTELARTREAATKLAYTLQASNA